MVCLPVWWLSPDAAPSSTPYGPFQLVVRACGPAAGHCAPLYGVGGGGAERGGAAVSTACAVPSPCSVVTVFFYHGGCWLVYVLNLQDGARIFPVHAIR